MRGCYENRITADTIHINASSAFDIIQVNIAVFCDQVNNVVFGAHLMGKIQLIYVDQVHIYDATNAKIQQTCIATGKSLAASGGKYTSTAFLGKG